jgi:hypothetical protein
MLRIKTFFFSKIKKQSTWTEIIHSYFLCHQFLGNNKIFDCSILVFNLVDLLSSNQTQISTKKDNQANKSKTDLCLFYKTDIMPITVIVDGVHIDILGVFFDSKLNWTEQVTSVI